MEARKASPLGRRWPLIPEDQDLDGLPARIAYHLAQLGLTAAQLQERGLPRDYARDLVSARGPMDEHNANSLARMLGVDTLCTPIPDEARRAWSFYLVSSRNQATVWAKVVTMAKNSGLSVRALAEHSDISLERIRNAYAGTPDNVLTFEEAERLCSLFGLERPERLVPERRDDPTQTPDR